MTAQASSPDPSPRKRSPWQWFKSLPKIKKVLFVLGVLVVIGAIGSALGDDTDQGQESEATEPDPEQGTERDDNDSDEDEANSGTDNQGSTAEAETEESPEDAQELPADIRIDAQVEALGDLEAFEGGEVFHRTPEQGEIDHAIFISQEYEPASFISSTLCTYAREDTIEALEFARDNITEDYDRIQMEFISRGEPEATGNRPIVGLATLNYERDRRGYRLGPRQPRERMGSTRRGILGADMPLNSITPQARFCGKSGIFARI